MEAACGDAPAWPSWPVLNPAAGLDSTEVALRAGSFPFSPGLSKHHHALYLRELAALDPAAGGHGVPGGVAGGRAALRLGAAETGGAWEEGASPGEGALCSPIPPPSVPSAAGG